MLTTAKERSGSSILQSGRPRAWEENPSGHAEYKQAGLPGHHLGPGENKQPCSPGQANWRGSSGASRAALGRCPGQTAQKRSVGGQGSGYSNSNSTSLQDLQKNCCALSGACEFLASWERKSSFVHGGEHEGCPTWSGGSHNPLLRVSLCPCPPQGGLAQGGTERCSWKRVWEDQGPKMFLSIRSYLR